MYIRLDDKDLTFSSKINFLSQFTSQEGKEYMYEQHMQYSCVSLFLELNSFPLTSNTSLFYKFYLLHSEAPLGLQSFIKSNSMLNQIWKSSQLKVKVLKVLFWIMTARLAYRMKKNYNEFARFGLRLEMPHLSSLQSSAWLWQLAEREKWSLIDFNILRQERGVHLFIERTGLQSHTRSWGAHELIKRLHSVFISDLGPSILASPAGTDQLSHQMANNNT